MSNSNKLCLIFWNVNGLNNLYNLDADDKVKILNGDIICLRETWNSNELGNLPDFLIDFKKQIIQSKAVKEKDRGRTSGGLVILIKDNLNIKVIVIELTHFWAIIELRLRNEKYVLTSVYFRPNLNDNECINILHDSLNLCLDTYTYHKFLVVGNFNAHIGQLNQADKELFSSPHIWESRNSLHNNINKRGLK